MLFDQKGACNSSTYLDLLKELASGLQIGLQICKHKLHEVLYILFVSSLNAISSHFPFYMEPHLHLGGFLVFGSIFHFYKEKTT